MKKLLNISVIAALAVLPMAANAAVTDAVPGPTVTGADATAATATTAPKYGLAQAGTNDGNVATAGYVKGAYNAAIKAINKVATTADSAVKSVVEGSTNGTVSVDGTDVAVHGLGSAAYTESSAYATAAQGTKAETAGQNVKVNGTALSEDSNGDVNVTIAEGATNGTVAVNGADVAVHGLGSAAYTDSSAYDAAGAASGVQSAIEGKLDDGATGYDIDAKTLKVQGQDVLTNAALTDYATKTGVAATVNAATGSVTGVNLTVAGTPTGTVSSSLSNTSISANVDVPTSGTVATLTTWGDDTSASTTSVALTTTSTAISGTVSGDVTSSFTGTGITSGTATGDITGIDVSVSGYQTGA